MPNAIVCTPIKYKGKIYIFKRDYKDWLKTKHINWYIRWESKTNKPGAVQGKNQLPISKYYHRYILNIQRGNKAIVDHINGNPLDNRRCNLRKCNHSQNSYNTTLSKVNRYGYKGVLKTKNKLNPYFSYIRFRKQNIFLGAYASIEEAAIAYMFGSLLYHKEFGAA